MTNADTIQATLVKLGDMCDDCLSTATHIRPRQTINANCRQLESNGRLSRLKRICTRCSTTKIVNRLTDETRLIAPSGAIPIVAPKSKPTFIRGEPNVSLIGNAVQELGVKLKSGELEIYNEFSLQHELGIIVRNQDNHKLVQFERNVSYFGFNKTEFVKREIDLVVYSRHAKQLDYVVELKFPRRGQHPEQMFSFCKDIMLDTPAECVIGTPLGAPVVPLVQIKYAMSLDVALC